MKRRDVISLRGRSYPSTSMAMGEKEKCLLERKKFL